MVSCLLYTSVTVLLQRIDVLDTTIADKTKEVEQKEAEVAESMQKFEKRLRAMYMTCLLYTSRCV